MYAQETSGSVRVLVMDQSGGVIADARVDLSGPGLPRPFNSVSAGNGMAFFPQVPPGSGYAISVAASNFGGAKIEGVAVELGNTTALEVRLDVGGVIESVDVSVAETMVDTQSSASAITIDKSFFDVISKGRSFYDLIAIAPGARNESKAAGYQVDGASGAENTFYLNGMELTDIQGGMLNDRNRLPVEMVQQVQVKNGIMEAQYGGAMGAVVSTVLRSGQNEYHGQAGFYWRNDAVAARPRPQLGLNPNDDNQSVYFQIPQDSVSYWNPVLDVGGPIIRNKLFFFAGYMPQLDSTTRTVNFTTGQRGTYGQTGTQQFLGTKVDYVPAPRLRMNMSWVWNPFKIMGILPSAQGTDAYSNNWAEQGSYTGNNIAMGEIAYLASNKLTFSFRGGYDYSGYNNLYGIAPVTAIYYSGQQSTTLPPPSLQAPNGWVQQAVGATFYDQNRRINLNGDLSYLVNWHGQHSIKGGWQMNRLSNDVLSSSYPFGYYRYYWGLTYHCQTRTCAETGDYGYYRYRVLGTIGSASSHNQALFLQDNWRVNRRLSVNIGLRTEYEFVPSYSTDPKIPSRAIVFDWPQKMSPRIGVAFDPKGNGRQRLYAGFGYFFDIMKYSLPRGSFGGDVWKEYFYTFDDPNLVTRNQGFAAEPTKLPGSLIEAVDYRIPSNDPGQHLIDPNLKPMKQRMLDIGYDYSLRSSLVASVRYTDRRLLSAIEDIGYASPDGEVYNIGNPGYGIVADPKNWLQWMGPEIPTTPKAVRDYDALELRLDKRFSTHYQFAASYTWSRLYGNYSGLANSDEGGRDSPNNSRYFDQPWIYADSQGRNTMGRLPTDRAQSFKFFGGYTRTSRLGSTTLSPSVFLFSGTPLTTQVQVIDTQGWMYINGRGDMGRTPFFAQCDLNLMHELAPFPNRESLKIRLEAWVFNLLNSSTVTDRYNLFSHTIDGPINVDSTSSIFTQGINARDLMLAQGIRVDPQYGKANAFQGPRYMRFQLSLLF
jgi:hypothetical protein